MWLDAGTYPVPSNGYNFTKAMAVKTYNGPVTIE